MNRLVLTGIMGALTLGRVGGPYGVALGGSLEISSPRLAVASVDGQGAYLVLPGKTLKLNGLTPGPHKISFISDNQRWSRQATASRSASDQAVASSPSPVAATPHPLSPYGTVSVSPATPVTPQTSHTTPTPQPAQPSPATPAYTDYGADIERRLQEQMEREQAEEARRQQLEKQRQAEIKQKHRRKRRRPKVH